MIWLFAVLGAVAVIVAAIWQHEQKRIDEGQRRKVRASVYRSERRRGYQE